MENVLKMGLAIRISMENIQTKPLCGWLWEETHVQKLWGRIPAPYTGWKIFTYICVVKIVTFGKTKMNKKRLGMAHFLKKQIPFNKRGFRVLSKRKNVAK